MIAPERLSYGAADAEDADGHVARAMPWRDTVNFAFSEEQEALRETVRKFLEDPVAWSRAHGGVGSLEEALAHKGKAG